MKFTPKNPEFAEHVNLTLLAVLIGIIAGLTSIAFEFLIHFFQKLFWRLSPIVAAVPEQPWFYTIFIPAIGGLIIAPMIYYGAREAKGHGVPEILESLIFRGGRIKPKVAVVKALASSVCIGTGGSAGREGPIVQISSSIASTFGRIFKVKERGMRTLVAAGAAGGIGATFNAPIAGALFAMEVLMSEFGVFSFSPIIVTSVIATLTERFLTGDFAAFLVPKYTLISIWEIGPYILLGIISGLVAIVFIKVLYFFEENFDNLRIHPLLKPMLGGLLVGGIGLAFPQILGTSYEAIDASLQSQIGILLACVLIFAKVLSTSLTLGSGGSGGVLAPSLFMGAMTGNFIGNIFHSLFPESISTPGAFSLVGMGAVLAAATHAPITAIIMIFEMTGDYKIILPLMLSCIIASLITAGLHRESIYTIKLKKKGLIYREGKDVNILRSLSVRDFISRDYQTFLNTERAGKIINQTLSGKQNCFQIVDGENNYLGYFSFKELVNLTHDKEWLDSLVIAEDIAISGISIDLNDTLEKAMLIFGGTNVDEIAVVKNGKFMGVVKRKDVIEAYNHEIMKREATSGLIQKLKFTNLTKSFDIGAGYKVTEILAPASFWDKNLIQLNLKARYGIDILLIKRKYPPRTITIPSAEETLKKGDILVLAGLEENITRALKE
jgi:CIC family chloride channel protein